MKLIQLECKLGIKVSMVLDISFNLLKLLVFYNLPANRSSSHVLNTYVYFTLLWTPNKGADQMKKKSFIAWKIACMVEFFLVCYIKKLKSGWKNKNPKKLSEAARLLGSSEYVSMAISYWN